MRICRIKFEGAEESGHIEGDHVILDRDKDQTRRVHVSEAEFLLPTQPSNIVCVGRNYADHAAELGNEVPKEPLLFLKAPSSLTESGAPVIIPRFSEQVEHEAELAIVIGTECRNLGDDEDPFKYVLGYTALNDVTARDLQKKDGQFARAKSFDSFCPIGRFIETDFDWTDASVKCVVNGEVRQDGRTSQMVFAVPFLIRYISNMMTLLPGDIIATGTPSGVSKLNPGDVCQVWIDGLDPLINPIA
jgi:2-keto-4-pentenoate hydratase/2-oxohepta-3-ene-1,7-dioic acid hydratase in catechol pathway